MTYDVTIQQEQIVNGSLADLFAVEEML